MTTAEEDADGEKVAEEKREERRGEERIGGEGKEKERRGK